MCQPGWDEDLGENGYMYMYGWDPSLFTWNSHNIYNWLCYCYCCYLVTKSCLALCTPWPIAHQAPMSMGSPGKNTGAGCHFLLQGIFPTQGSNLGLLHCRQYPAFRQRQGSIHTYYFTQLIFKSVKRMKGKICPYTMLFKLHSNLLELSLKFYVDLNYYLKSLTFNLKNFLKCSM